MIPSLLDSSIATFDEDSLELALQCTELCLDNSTIAKLVNVRTNGCEKFTPDQIKYILARHEAEKLVGQFDSSRSSAQQLLDDFEVLTETDPTLQYVAMIHAFEEGYYIKMPAGRPSLSIGDQQNMNISDIRKSMEINDGQDVLLGFAWVTGEELKTLAKFPEFLAIDVTEKTNKEKRGLFVGTGLDGQGKIFLGFHCFMPNAQQVSFNWVYKYALPALWSEELIAKIQVIVSDGEKAMYGPLQNLSETGSAWSGLFVQR